MRLVIAAALCLGQAGGIAQAAELDGRSPFVENQRGAFAGVRLRASLGSDKPDMRASIAVAPTSHSPRAADSPMAMGDGWNSALRRARTSPS